jgi:hypothetical protein
MGKWLKLLCAETERAKILYAPNIGKLGNEPKAGLSFLETITSARQDQVRIMPAVSVG